MTDHSRREFLRKLAQGSIYAAPVVSTLLAPRSASAQASQMMMMMGGGMGMGMGMGMMEAQQGRQGPDAPWSRPPPGR